MRKFPESYKNENIKQQWDSSNPQIINSSHSHSQRFKKSCFIYSCIQLLPDRPDRPDQTNIFRIIIIYY